MTEHIPAPTELLYYTDAYLREFDSRVVAVDGERDAIALAETAFFPTGGGQPHDTGELRFEGTEARVVDVRKEGAVVWHLVAGAAELHAVGAVVHGLIDSGRRYLIMRIHTAQHILNGIIWRDYGAHVTGAQITPPEGRLDFELPTMSQEFARTVAECVNEVVEQDLPAAPRRGRPRPVADPAQGEPDSALGRPVAGDRHRRPRPPG